MERLHGGTDEAEAENRKWVVGRSKRQKTHVLVSASGRGAATWAVVGAEGSVTLSCCFPDPI
jgi:hypothetical protein